MMLETAALLVTIGVPVIGALSAFGRYLWRRRPPKPEDEPPVQILGPDGRPINREV